MNLTFSVSPSSLNCGEPTIWTTLGCGRQRVADCSFPDFQIMLAIAYAKASCCIVTVVGISGLLVNEKLISLLCLQDYLKIFL